MIPLSRTTQMLWVIRNGTEEVDGKESQKGAGFLVLVRRVVPMQVLIPLFFPRLAHGARSQTSRCEEGDGWYLVAKEGHFFCVLGHSRQQKFKACILHGPKCNV